jgi:hypothetical protein
MDDKRAKERFEDLEKAYMEVLPDFNALKLPAEQIRFNVRRFRQKVETVTTYGAYDQPI